MRPLLQQCFEKIDWFYPVPVLPRVSRLTIDHLPGVEVVTIAVFSVVLCLLMHLAVSRYDQQLVRTLFIQVTGRGWVGTRE